MMSRKQIVIMNIFVFLIFLVIAKGSFAEENIKFNIDMGYEGKIKLGEINPIKITVITADNGISGKLFIKLGDDIYTHKLIMGEYTKKFFSFSVPFFKANEKIEIFIKSNEKILYKKQLKPVVLPKDTIFIATLCDKPEQMSFLKNMDFTLFDSKNIEVFSLKPDDYYTLSELQCINYILIDNFNVARLSDNQQKVLKNWVELGNTIFVGTGEYKYKTLKGIFDGLNGVKKIGNGFIVSTGMNIDEKNSGHIRIQLEKYISPIGLEKIMKPDRLQNQILESKKLYAVADSLLHTDYNVLMFFLALLILYLVCVLLGIFMEKRFKWLFAVVVLMFCVVFYSISLWGGLYSIKAASASINLYQCCGQKYDIYNIYPYKSSDIILNIPDTAYLKNFETQETELNPIEKKVLLTGTEPKHLFAVKLNTYENQHMSICIDSHNIASGEIKNPISDKMYNCFLIIGNNIIPIGDVDGKETVKINYKLDNILTNKGDYNYIRDIYNAVKLDNYQRELFEYYFYNVNDITNKGKLFGFTKNICKVNVNEKVQSVKQISLNVFDVPIESIKGNINMPFGLIEPVVDERKIKKLDTVREYILEEGKILNLYYVLPKDIESGQINITAKVETGKYKMEIFNPIKNKWELLNDKSLLEKNSKCYFDRGIIKIRIEGKRRIIIPQIAVKGKVKG
ncbi:hypothetical protein SAMN02745883_01173 [Caminicella sporogenes DSM 14501]|uniref:Uncharacterized protein n=1 Tax=Caminicella sporogenes DSM 14501 TaxID=1121266 RepID=A0A1M6PEL4_9FIRM|nr:hypothetical protein [Caminicella sporogenes]RKD21427.1 hypothetical protein BET04_08290 [Caminicella sporogenes]SHK06376.1 hypothetical protein SAMN02745883_01173 [Caminicella sporogenes DSM 14501]